MAFLHQFWDYFYILSNVYLWQACVHVVSGYFTFLLTLATSGPRFLSMLRGNEKPPPPVCKRHASGVMKKWGWMRVCVPLENVGIVKEEEQGEEKAALLSRSRFPFQIKTHTFRSGSKEGTNPCVHLFGGLENWNDKKRKKQKVFLCQSSSPCIY